MQTAELFTLHENLRVRFSQIQRDPNWLLDMPGRVTIDFNGVALGVLNINAQGVAVGFALN